VGWRALLAAGLVPVRALDVVARAGDSAAALAAREGLARYALGIPWAEALGRAWREAGLWPLAWLATALSDAEARGRRSVDVLAEQEHRLRQAQRVQALEHAHAISGRFVLVLTLTYLPAFLVGVLVPLFIAVMTRAFQ
jgi:Flp pilus assembly protein TadB